MSRLASRLLLVATLVLLAMRGLALPAQAAVNWQDEEEHRQRLETVKRNIQQLQQRIAGIQTRRSKEEQALRDIEVRIQSRVREIRRLDGELDTLNRDIAQLAEEERETQRALQHQKTLLAEQLRAAHAMGREPGLKLLLDADSPREAQRLLTYYEYLNRARLEEIESYRTAIERVESIRGTLLDRNRQLTESSTRLAQARQELEQEKTQREKAIADVGRQLRRSEKELGQMIENQKQLEAVLREVEKAVANLGLTEDATPFAELRRKLPWPASGPVVRDYGSKSADGIGSTGIVIRTAVNTPVRAVHHGRIVFSDWLRGFGLLIIVDHGEGFMSLYGYNQALLKETGEWVSQGDVLASSGSSGGQNDAGLYFEIRHQGKPENPLRWLRKNA